LQFFQKYSSQSTAMLTVAWTTECNPEAQTWHAVGACCWYSCSAI